MGCARDIVERAGVPRFWFSNFPLGHSAGKPHDPQSQLETINGALSLLSTATQANTTAVSSQSWASSDDWERDFMSTENLTPERVQALQQAHEQTRSTKRAIQQKDDSI